MATFVLVHGAGDSGWYWHLAQAELRARGHRAVAPDLPCDHKTASLDDYADAVAGAAATADAAGAAAGQQDLVIVGQSYGAFAASLAASRLGARLLVLLAGMIPAPGETPGQWWASTGYQQAAEEQARLDGGQTGNEDPLISYYNGVPRALAEEALRRAAAASPPWSGIRPGHSAPGRTCPPSSSWARTTTSSRPPSCAGWPGNASAPSRTRCRAVTAPRSATRGS